MKALVGVTASGKSQVAVAIAEHIGAEVICADSMTIWRGLDVGTAKPSPELLRRVPHHVLDLAEPGERPSVASIAAAARAAVAGIEARGKVALVVGGSGLHLRAIIDGLEFPPTDPTVRASLEALSPAEVLRRLQANDPDSLTHIDPANIRRAVRALEILELTGRPASSFRTAWGHRPDLPVAGLSVPQDVLGARVRERTRQMLASGWLEECARFDAAGRRDDVLKTQALGYREVFEVLDGFVSIDEAAKRIEAATLRLAKRQLTWFRADPRIVWVDATDLDRATEGVLGAYA